VDRTDKRIVAGFRNLVAERDMPPPPLRDWLVEEKLAGMAGEDACRVVELSARWPENLEGKRPAGLSSMAATLALAASLAFTQASGWINPIDQGSGRLLADPGVRYGLEAALHLAQTGRLPVTETQ
jgi:hypothetical protein